MKNFCLLQVVVLFLCSALSVESEDSGVCKAASEQEEGCHQEAAEYGTIKLKPLFIDGEPDPALVDVPKLFFIEVRFSFVHDVKQYEHP